MRMHMQVRYVTEVRKPENYSVVCCVLTPPSDGPYLKLVGTFQTYV